MSFNIPSSSGGSAGTPQNSYAGERAPVASATRPSVEDVDEDDEEQNPASLLVNNPALMAMVESRLGTLVGRSSGYIESLPAAVRSRVDGLKGVQVEHSKIESEFQLAILDLEKKFAAKYAPLYERRAAIIAGSAEPTPAEIEAGQAADEDDEDEDEGARVTEIDEDASSSGPKGIPEFWLTALKNHPEIAETITERDEEALKSLIDVKLDFMASTDASPGFSLTFVFSPNDYFTSLSLTKTYYYQKEVGYGGDLVYDKAKGTEITWKDAEKDLTKTTEIKKQRNKNTNKTRVVKKVVPTASFFNFFSPPSPPSMEALESGDVDEEELEELDEKLAMDYELGEAFKERVIPRAVDYFTGKALEYEGEGEDEDFDDEFDESAPEDDDEEDAAPRVPAANAAGDPQECKQQ